jgi:DNA-binding transcriptional LysR family regulator
VGRRLNALEAALEVQLFTRAQDGFLPTAAGTDILSLAEDAERAVVSVERKVAGGDKSLSGTVRITTSETFSGFLVRHLVELRAEHPSLMVDVLSSNVSLDIARNEADIAIRFVETTQPDLVSKRLCDAGWSLYASESYIARSAITETLENLGHHDFIGYNEAMAHSPGGKWLEEHKAGAHIVLSCNSIRSALDACVAGMGVAVIPCFIADTEPRLRRLTDDVVASRAVWLVFHPEVAKVKRVRTVIDFVSAIVSREAAGLRGERAPP